MVIVIYSQTPLDLNDDLKVFHPYADKEDLHLFNSDSETKQFLEQHLLQKQKHIDLLVVLATSNNAIEDQADVDHGPDSLIEWIRSSRSEYSENNFNFKSIPAILVDNPTFFREHPMHKSRKKLYDLVQPNTLLYGGTASEYYISKAIGDWVQKVGDELDRLDLDLNFAFAKSRVAKTDTYENGILSFSFLRKQKALKYLWIGKNIEQIERTLYTLDNRIKVDFKTPNVRNEKSIHQLLMSEDLILQGEHFRQSLYEKHFYYRNSRKYVEPDFINIPHGYSLSNPEIFEVKLANQRLVTNNTMGISRYLRKSLAQVVDKYMPYFKDSNNIQSIEKNAGIRPGTFKYTLLIGHEDSLLDQPDLFTDLEERHHITLLTYNDLLKRYARIHERVKRVRLY